MQFVSMFWDSLVSVVKTFTIADLVDILIVSYLIYKAIQIVRDTRAGQLMKGLLILGAVYLASSIFGFKALNFIMNNIFTFGLLAVVVVFQPELRRALERVGQSKIPALSHLLPTATSEIKERVWMDAISQIVEACDRLSSTKTGALIVLERQTKLGDLLPVGTIIDAQTSASLLCNIFYPNSPMHDGAVIIRDARVLAAGCFLPSTQKGEFVDKQLGSRHRAALGMSENSDAIILVVSEETGTVSAAENGKLIRDFNSIVMTQFLQERLVPEANSHLKTKGFWGRFKK